MDEKMLNKELMVRVGRKFYGHANLYSKYMPKIPASAEREYIRLVNEYTSILKEELETEWPAIKEVYKRERDAEVQGHREDSATDLTLTVSQIFAEMNNKITAKTTGFGLRRRLESLAHLNRKLAVKEWKKAIKATLGIDIREDYYLGDFYLEHLAEWVSENVGLITSIPENTLGKMKDIVLEGFDRGRRTTDMAKDIQLAYGVSRKKARFIARDQTAKLNGQIQRAQQMDAGIKEYIWSDSGDERVRRSHRELNGKKFSWEGDGPETDNGRHCHPGQDFNCRCIARPVFNQNINLPVTEDAGVHATVQPSLAGQSGILSKEGGIERMKNVAEGMGDLSLYSEHYVTADPEWRKAKYSGAFYDAMGYNNLPKVVSEVDFEKIASSFPTQYRGVQSRQQVEDFMFGKRYIGGGANGTGTNVSADFSTAKSYAEEDSILTMKLSVDAKVIKDSDLIEFVRAFRGELSDSDGILGYVATDPGAIAAALGYDAIEDTSTGWLNVLNRSKVIVKSNK